MEKLPLIECVNRWIDIYTYLHYPESVREKAYEIAYRNAKRGFPHILAGISVYVACEIIKTKFDFELMQKISKAHRGKVTDKSGIKLFTIQQEAKKWI